MSSIVTSGKTVEEAVQAALASLKLSKDEVNIEILDEGAKAIFGLFGGKLARVKVTSKEGVMGNPDLEEIDIKMEMKRILRGEDEAPPKKPVQEKRVREEAVKEEFVETDDVALNFMHKLVGKFGLKADIAKTEKDGMIYLDVTGRSLGVLIGRRGETLDALQYIVNLVAAKDARESGDTDKTRYILDVEGYRRKREEGIVDTALQVAKKVASEGKSEVLEPMSAMERRAVHTALQEVDGVTTYSEGRDPFRRVVIAPAE